LVPSYRLTANLTSKQIRFLVKQVIGLAEEVKDWLPQDIIKDLKLISLPESIIKIHFPKTENDIQSAKKRLSFDELFLVQLQAQLIKQSIRSSRTEAILFKEEETKKFIQSLPFRLTDAQRKCAWEILQDMAKETPMARLLEGDVGSGKTVVATIAMLNAVLNKKQAALMVPTEILAQQHYNSICRLLKDSGVRIGLITRSVKKLNSEIESLELKPDSDFIIQNSDIIVGTHALLQEKTRFRRLALVIVDEQHRFGVEQRKTLMEKSGHYPSPPLGKESRQFVPHLLSMTATPIPRSLALALYGDLDLSIIDQMPANRKKILTRVVTPEEREKSYGFVYAEIKKGRQAFIVCPLIDPSDKLVVKSVKEEFEKIAKHIFPEFKVGMLHGRMKAKEKEEIMKEFLENKIDILVSTSVIEVGVDVPNAAIMMIEGADRFGLAQLHQFRGRVGRAEHQSYCLLYTESDSAHTLKRLGSLVQYSDGIALAKIDLKFRGPGEVYGTMQKGFPELKMASLFDYGLMKMAKEKAEEIVEKDASLDSWPELKERVGDWERRVHLE
ncbi:MAG: ATP-dependent DNA helicase RecG, partial [Patescibacteria group bacterium]